MSLTVDELIKREKLKLLEIKYIDTFKFDQFFNQFYDFESDKLLDQKIKYIEKALEQNTEIINLKDSEEVFELMSKERFNF